MNQKRIIKAALFTPNPEGRWGLPILFEGRPGVAKTATLKQVARACGLRVEVLIAAIRQPDDFLGIPVPSADGRSANRLLDIWATRVGERGVVLFDEIKKCAPQVQAALLRVIHEGAVGEYTLPPGVRFMAACNPAEYGGWDLDPAMANRFGHLTWDVPGADEWNEWLLGTDFAPHTPNGLPADALEAAAEEARVLDASAKPFALARGKVAGFVHKRPELLVKEPAAGSPEQSRAWPSLRSWANATWALAGAEIHGLPEAERDELFAAFIGRPAAAEYLAYDRNLDLPDPIDLLDGKVAFKHDARRLDLTCAVLSACSALLVPPPGVKDKSAADVRKARAIRLWGVMGDVVKAGDTDCAVPAGRALCNPKVGLSHMAEARPVLTKMAPVLIAAGLMPSS